MTEELRERLAKAMADKVGHGMTEKCYRHADAAIEVFHTDVKDAQAMRSLRACIRSDVDDFKESGDFNQSLMMYIGKIRNTDDKTARVIEAGNAFDVVAKDFKENHNGDPLYQIESYYNAVHKMRKTIKALAGDDE